MLPQKTQATNLLVPVCMSASHIAYASLRMEPQYMILGQAAGTAAKIAIEQQRSVQDIDIELLKLNLQKNGAVLDLSE